MIVETAPIGGESFDSSAPVVAGRIGPSESSPAVADAVPVSTAGEVAVDSVQPESTAPTSSDLPQATEAVDQQEKDKEKEKENLFWAELKLLGALSEAEGFRQEVEETLDDAVEREKNLSTALGEVRNEIPELRTQVEEARTAVLAISRDIYTVVKGKTIPKRPGGDADATSVPAAAPAAAEPEVDANAWRQLSTAELLQGVPRLGETKLTAICEKAPTVGDLEDLRGEASKQHKPFKELLPKGCGQCVADAIEDRLVTHIAKYAREAATASGKPATGLADELVTSIRAQASEQPWRPEDCRLDDQDTDMTRQGFAAHGEGKPYSALPTQDPQLAHQWMVGWVSAEVIATSASAPPSDKASSQSEAN